MAAPTLQAQGSVAAVDTGSVTPTLPSHQADDILVAQVVIWSPATSGHIDAIPDPSGWTTFAGGGNQNPRLIAPADDVDGAIGIWWKRAASGAESDPVFTRGANWSTGAGTCYAARCYVIRGAATGTDPYELYTNTLRFGASGSYDALTVFGSERLAIQFYGSTDDQSSGAAVSGWTAGTEELTTVGTDAGFQTFRQDNVSSTTSSDNSNASAPAQGAYSFHGIVFVPATTPGASAGYQNIMTLGVG